MSNGEEALAFLALPYVIVFVGIITYKVTKIVREYFTPIPVGYTPKGFFPEVFEYEFDRSRFKVARGTLQQFNYWMAGSTFELPHFNVDFLECYRNAFLLSDGCAYLISMKMTNHHRDRQLYFELQDKHKLEFSSKISCTYVGCIFSPYDSHTLEFKRKSLNLEKQT